LNRNTTQTWINLGPKTVSAAEVDTLLAGLAHIPERRLLIHFHGGLVNEAAGFEIAQRMADSYAGAGVRPITVIWETGVIETLTRNLKDLHKTKLFRKLLAWAVVKVAEHIGIVEGGRGPGGVMLNRVTIETALTTESGVAALDNTLRMPTPVAGAKGRSDISEEQIELELLADLPADEELLELAEGEGLTVDSLKKATTTPVQSKGVELWALARFLAKVVIATVRRHLNGTDHDPYPTAVEELLRAAYLADLGTWLWDEMKKSADGMWRHDHVGDSLLKGLASLQAQRPDLTIDLVGHSAGSIAICCMIESIAGRDGTPKIRNIVFLAPACRLDLFAKALARTPDRAATFRLFTMNDEHEKEDKLVPLVYPRSLLYLVSGVLEDIPDAALAGLARHLERARDANHDFHDVREWLAAENRLVYAPTAPNSPVGLACHAVTHGAFDDDEVMLGSLVALARA
jgi:hypothetical protein